MPTIINLPSGVSKKKIEEAYLVKAFLKLYESIVDKCKNNLFLGGAIQKDGGLYYVQGNQSRLDAYVNVAEDFTVEFVVNVKEVNTYQAIFVTGGGNGALQANYHNTLKSITFGVYGGGGLHVNAPNSFENMIGKDTHVAIVKSGTNWKMYYDGVEVAAGTGSISSFGPIYIGGYVGQHSKQYGMNNTILKMFKVTQRVLLPSEFEKMSGGVLTKILSILKTSFKLNIRRCF